MKKIYILFLLLNFITSVIFAQNKYHQHELATIGKTWGLLKYHHPEIATGKHNWDSILIVSIDNILTSKRDNQVNVELGRMFEIAGENTTPAYVPKSFHPISYKNYDQSWIENNKILTKQQKQLLTYAVKHPYRGLNFYAQPNPDNDSTVFTPNENPYKEMIYPDVNYRLLGLFRFWNVINYFYPYKYAIGKQWDLILNEMIPLMIVATDTQSYHRALAKMAASINDSHGGLWPSVFTSFVGKYSPPFNFMLIDGKAVVTKILDDELIKYENFQVGSIINSINGISIKKRIKQFIDDVPASNYGGKLKSMHAFILNSHIPEATFSGTNAGGGKFEITIKQMERDFLKDHLDFFQMTSPVTAKVIEGNIGYVFFSNVNNKNLDSTMSALAKTKAIVFDMRNYPRYGDGTYRIPDYLLSEPRIYARNTYPDFNFPGMFNYVIANERTRFSQVGKHNPNPYSGKIIILVDARTQSAAEWACMTLMAANKVTVIGSQTAGADGNVTRTILPGNYKINFSGLGIYFPDGTETQRRGIPIDIKVRYRIHDIIKNNDPVLGKAIKFINRK